MLRVMGKQRLVKPLVPRLYHCTPEIGATPPDLHWPPSSLSSPHGSGKVEEMGRADPERGGSSGDSFWKELVWRTAGRTVGGKRVGVTTASVQLGLRHAHRRILLTVGSERRESPDWIGSNSLYFGDRFV